MNLIPTDCNDFALLRLSGQVYVDKTAYLHRLISDPTRHFYFLARPRRFGKTLMISTLKAIFQGRRDLFDHLEISKTDYDWPVHPVIHLNMGFCAAENYEMFWDALPGEMERALHEAGYVYHHEWSYAKNFGDAIDWFAGRGASPVIFIDEYDDPVARALKNIETAEKVRSALAPLYGQLKDRSGSIRFLMITGVSKFTKMSVFSALSSLNDLTFEDEAATMLGYTEQELEGCFAEHIAAHARVMNLKLDEYRARLKWMYNGYRFGLGTTETVYNPVSINLTLNRQQKWFRAYWTDTGRASMLMNMLERQNVLAIDPERLDNVSSREFDVTNLRRLSVAGMLFQTGYLTIKDYFPETDSYSLGVPDDEVRRDLATMMASLCANRDAAWASTLGLYLLNGSWQKFFRGLKALYAGVAYGAKEDRVCEHSFGRCLAFLLQGQGILCQPEVTQADGRVDMVCTHPCGIFIFELKVDRPAAVAMAQIERKAYAEPYSADGRPIWLIGLSFDSATRQLADAAAELYQNS